MVVVLLHCLISLSSVLPKVKVGGAKVAAGGGSSSARLTSVSRTRSSISSARASSWATPATTSSALEKTFAASSGKN
jgi:hypothetical protein